LFIERIDNTITAEGELAIRSTSVGEECVIGSLVAFFEDGVGGTNGIDDKASEIFSSVVTARAFVLTRNGGSKWAQEGIITGSSDLVQNGDRSSEGASSVGPLKVELDFEGKVSAVEGVLAGGMELQSLKAPVIFHPAECVRTSDWENQPISTSSQADLFGSQSEVEFRICSSTQTNREVTQGKVERRLLFTSRALLVIGAEWTPCRGSSIADLIRGIMTGGAANSWVKSFAKRLTESLNKKAGKH
jgi:hypothetical protein